MDANTDFAQWLKNARQKRDITQDALASSIGYSVRTIQKLETGERRPSREVAQLIARYFGLPENEVDEFVQFARPSARQVPGARTAEASFPVGHAWPQVPERPQRHLPIPGAPLVGRDEETAEVVDMLLDPSIRMLTLTGPAGIGKTRLALNVAEKLSDEFSGGTFFVELSAVRDPSLVLPTIARTIGLREVLGQPLLQAIDFFLHGKKALLVLDNLEQVVDGGGRVIPMLAELPTLKVMVTTREVLHLSMEHVYQVPPLAMPTLPHGSTLRSTDHLRIAQSASVRMFEQRARAVDPDFSITPANALPVAQICHKLEGLPLAIELAAARVKVASPDEILRRLHRGLISLSATTRDAEPRQQSLHGAIDWSYRLLTEPEKNLFRQLAVFSGRFTMDAAEQVCEVEQAEHLPHVMDGIEALLDKSLLHESFGGPNEHSFRMLDMMREFAEARLRETGQLAEVQARHAAYYLNLAESGAPWMVTREQVHWLEVLDTARDNIRAALDWFADTGRWLEALRLVGSMVVFWLLRGYSTEGRQLLQIAIGIAPPPRPETARYYSRALWGIGVLAGEQGDYQAGRVRLQESIRLSEQAGDTEGLARALSTLGLVALGEGNNAEAREHLQKAQDMWSAIMERNEPDEEARWGHAISLTYRGMVEIQERAFDIAFDFISESLTCFRLLGSRWGTALALTCLGNVHYWQGEFAAAQPLYEESVRHLRQIEGHGSLAWVLTTLGHIALRDADWQRGETIYREALNLHRSSNANKTGMAYTLNGLGEIARARGDYGRALDLYDQSLSLFREMEDERGAAWMLHNIAAANYLRGDFARAERFYSESLPLLVKHDVVPGISCALAGAAGVMLALDPAAQEGAPSEEAIKPAAMLTGAADAQLAARSATLEPVDRIVYSRLVSDVRKSAKAARLPAAYATWAAEGERLSLEEAVALALPAPSPSGGPKPSRFNRSTGQAVG